MGTRGRGGGRLPGRDGASEGEREGGAGNPRKRRGAGSPRNESGAAGAIRPRRPLASDADVPPGYAPRITASRIMSPTSSHL